MVPSALTTSPPATEKWPLAMRLLHWLRALIVLGMIWAGWTMVAMNDNTPSKFELFYPYHKSFGLLALGLTLTQLAIRWTRPTPGHLPGLHRGEVILSKIVHTAIYVLLLIVPLMGYAMSSSFTQSDGVYFFGAYLPELLPKNDQNFELFRLAHRVLAYTLLGLVAVHILGALKHRFMDRDKSNDVLRRMI